MLVVKGFNTEFLTHKKKYYKKNRYSPSIKQNTEDLVIWIKKTLKNCVPILLKGYNYNCQALRLNKENLDEISKHVNSMDFLNFSPATDDSLERDELGIELSELIVKDN